MRSLGRIVLCAVVMTVLLAGMAMARPDPLEMKEGDAIYSDMLSAGYLVPHSPDAKLLVAVASQLKVVGDDAYGASFSFYLDRSQEINAFYARGPRVYVNDGLLRVADNREELAGILCHEMAHALHRDGTKDEKLSARYDQKTENAIKKLDAMTHGHFSGTIQNISDFGEKYLQNHHSRSEEEQADLAGSDLCATAKFNPWGMVWFLQKMQRAHELGWRGVSWFRDHPNYNQRIAMLKKHFRANPI